MDQTAIAAFVLFGLVALRFIIVGIGAALLLRPVRDCPACFANSTFRAHRPVLRRIAPWLEIRFCPRCGWQGPSRVTHDVPDPPTSNLPSNAHGRHAATND